MPKNLVAINTTEARYLLSGEPILDTHEGVLIIAFEDGSSRTFNWRYVIDFYPLTQDEIEELGNKEGYL